MGLILVSDDEASSTQKTKGGKDGTDRYSYWHDEWPARPAPTQQRRWWRRHVADHDGAARAPCLQGPQGPGRSSCISWRYGPANATRRHSECRHSGWWAGRYPWRTVWRQAREHAKWQRGKA